MKTIEQLKAEQEKQLAELEYRLAIAKQCPVTPDRVIKVSTGEAAWVTYKVKGIRGALEILRQFDPVVPFSEARDGCLYLQPEELMKEGLKEKAEGFYAVRLDVDQGEGFGPSAKLSFYARIPEAHGGGVLVRVQCDIEGPGYIGMYHGLGAQLDIIRDHGGRIIDHKWSRNPDAGAIADKVIKWGSGSDTSARFSYLFCADQAEDWPGKDQSHAMGQLVNLADILKEG